MKTFDFVVDNLGPVKHAVFAASHLNLVCGKNNTGKSFLMHAIYYLFSFWKYRIDFDPHEEDVEQLARNGTAIVDMRKYLGLLNGWIARSMPGFIEQLPLLMNKNRAAFAGCNIEMRVDDAYAMDISRHIYVQGEFEIVKGVSLRIMKEVGSYEVRVEMNNKNKEFPAHPVVARALRAAIGATVIDVIPTPKMLTAERVGTLLYGADIHQYALRNEQDRAVPNNKADDAVADHYPRATFDELAMLTDMYRQSPDRGRLLADDANYRRVYSDFLSHVANGRYENQNGRCYYVESGTENRIDVKDASTSVKSLAFVDFFIQECMSPGTMLMVDEPEMNLHPERQRALARLLARMANMTGVGVAISTHSDILIREFNTLLAFGMHENLSEVAGRFGYDREEFATADTMACAVVGDGRVEQVDIGSGQGLVIPNFDATIDTINVVQDTIMGEISR